MKSSMQLSLNLYLCQVVGHLPVAQENIFQESVATLLVVQKQFAVAAMPPALADNLCLPNAMDMEDSIALSVPHARPVTTELT